MVNQTHIRVDPNFSKTSRFFWIKKYSLLYFYYILFYIKYKERFFDYKCYKAGKIIKLIRKMQKEKPRVRKEETSGVIEDISYHSIGSSYKK
jgi:hypothetical protein